MLKDSPVYSAFQMLNVLLWYDSTDKEILIDLDAKVEPLVEGLNDSIEKHDSEFCHARKD